jgi:hypothetical protein
VTEPVEQPRPPATQFEPPDPEAESARANMLWGWALFALFLLLFGGTFLVAFVYNVYSS